MRELGKTRRILYARLQRTPSRNVTARSVAQLWFWSRMCNFSPRTFRLRSRLKTTTVQAFDVRAPEVVVSVNLSPASRVPNSAHLLTAVGPARLLDGRSPVLRNTRVIRGVLTGVVLVLGASACGGGDSAPTVSERPEVFQELSPPVLPSPGPDPVNQYADDERAAVFGQRLFFDARFSGELLDGDNDGSASALGLKGEVGKVSCAGCHVPSDGFSDTRSIRQQISLAAGWGKRRAPSLLDVGQSPILTWGGRWDSFFGQAIGVFESDVEANSSRLFVAYQVLANHREEYESIFGPLPPFDDTTRFPPLTATQTGCRVLDDMTNACPTPMRGRPGDGAEFDGLTSEDQRAVTEVAVNVGKALGAYQRLLTCGPSRFDAWVQGDDTALDEQEQRGAELFVGKARCVECHSGPFL